MECSIIHVNTFLFTCPCRLFMMLGMQLEKTKTAKAIDLTPLASKTNYVVNSATTQGNSYQFNLCAAMHNAAAPCTSSSMVCEYTNSQATANYGAIDNIQVSRGSGNIAAILVSKGDACPTLLGAKSTATFNFVCDSSVKTPTFKLLEDLPNQCKVTIQVTSKYACPGSGGGSIGTVLVAVFIGVLALYFIAGAGLMYRQGHGGSELIVHKTFWCGLPGLIGDGFGCCFNTIRGKPMGAGSEYSSLK
eukprot:m.146011 g.146011  ORF g.146011 m.146011 type:complete len:247 (-) comp14148_c1_seq3:321-1061(-)